MIKDRGIDAIINDLLIDNVLTMGSLLVALLTALLSYLYLKYTHPEYNVEGAYYIPVAVFAFLIGLQMVQLQYPCVFADFISEMITDLVS